MKSQFKIFLLTLYLTFIKLSKQKLRNNPNYLGPKI